MGEVSPEQSHLFKARSAGVLLHPTSLPCSESCWHSVGEGTSTDNSSFNRALIGTLGKDAYRFVDFIAESGLKIWQMLPMGPTPADGSPYQSISAHAGNPDVISLDWLVEQGWVTRDAIQLSEKTLSGLAQARAVCAKQFHAKIKQEEGAGLREGYNNFYAQQAYWLEDFVLFSALREHYGRISWVDWPEDLRKHDATALKKIKDTLQDAIDVFLFEQFAFFSQWQSLRSYAKHKGIYFFGDMPIFVGHDSADVWAQQYYFQLDENSNPLTVAGVPPDYFSETGQHWGNPHYDWEKMQADGFQWWLARIRTQLQLFDLIRIDHFRGFEAYWSIPGDSHDARLGHWVKAPGEAFLKACFEAYPGLPLVAENLGLITDEVEALRHQFNLPGMLVLQFAFDGNTNNPHLPHNHCASEVIYTGTHDNDTTVGWYDNLPQHSREQMRHYCFNSTDEIPWLLIKAAFASVGRLAVVPMQDFLELDGRHRMNMPGTIDNNWAWTFSWDQLDPELAAKIRQLLASYHRLG